MIYIGIDVGLQGAVAIINEKRDLLHLQEMPTFTVEVSGKTRRKYHCQGIWTFLANRIERPCLAVLENIHSMPGQSSQSMFSLGHGVGIMEGILTSLEIP